ncbi:DSLE protein, partial [Rhinopomastus cyanomelas]|nr:DSLE protein [Rhinopomastus cyanomelas]
RQEAAAGCAAPSAGFSAAARRKSKVWNYYSKLGDAFVECNVCRKQLSFHNSTTTMREHLARKHGIRDAPEPALHPEPPRRGRKTPDGAFSRGEALGELLLGMVCRDLQPLATVKDEGFGRLVAFLEPGLSLPALSHLGGLLRCRYVAARSRLQRLLQGAAGSVVLSVEPWAPAPHRRYISVAAHWVDGEWRRIRCLLATRPAPTGATCGEELRSILGSFGVEPAAVLCVVQRDAGDEDGAAAQQEGGWRRLRCAAHGLQRSV